MNTKIIISFLIILFGNQDLKAQKKVFYYHDTGFDTLTLYDNNTFSSIGGVGLAQKIEYSGIYTTSKDTIFLIQKTPTIINNIQKIEISDYESKRVDTLIVVDSLTLIFINFNNYGFYKLIELYNDDKLVLKKNWSYEDRTLTNISINGKFFKAITINNYPLQDGKEFYFDRTGLLTKECYWEKGERKSCKDF